MEQYRLNNILYLKGVDIQEIDEDEMDRLVMDKFAPTKKASTFQDSQELSFDECEPLPGSFVDITSWPVKTHLKCWHCDLCFSSKPISMPYKVVENSDQKFEFKVRGCFCTFSCMQRYLNTLNIAKYFKEKYQTYINTIYFLYYGLNVHVIKEAPDKYQMIHYGGGLRIPEYRNKLQSIDKETYDLALKKMGSPVPVEERCGIRVENIYSRDLSTEKHKESSIWLQFGVQGGDKKPDP